MWLAVIIIFGFLFLWWCIWKGIKMIQRIQNISSPNKEENKVIVESLKKEIETKDQDDEMNAGKSRLIVK